MYLLIVGLPVALTVMAEDQLLQKQLHVRCLRSEATAQGITAEFSKYGNVQQVQLQRFEGEGASTRAQPLSRKISNLSGVVGLHGGHSSSSSSSSFNNTSKQKPPPLPRAVVEFTDAAGAAAALAARCEVQIFSGRNGVRSSTSQLVLPAAGIGHLKEPCTCRRYRRQCTCPGYVK
jgi:hypothetical protein